MITCFIVSENGLLFNLRILYCFTAFVKYNQEVNKKYDRMDRILLLNRKNQKHYDD